MSFVIRRGDEKDVPGMFRLIKELAEYERAPKDVINTEKMLLEDGFGPKSIYKVFVAEEVSTNDIIGMALYYTAYSTWNGKIFYIDDIIVTERYRRYGIGKKLVDLVLKEAHHEGLNQVRWHVLEWNTPAIEFYKKMKVVFDTEWTTCKMNKQQIADYVSWLK